MWRLKDLARGPHAAFSNRFFDPWDMLKRWRGLWYFRRNLSEYRRRNRHPTFAFSPRDRLYRSYDRFSAGGGVPMHYFQQDLWAARWLSRRGVRDHVDVGSRVDGFVAHVLTFAAVTFVDIRPLDADVRGLRLQQGSITAMPFGSDSVPSLSSLHVIEHVGLGRYGDAVNPDGHLAAAAKLSRVLQPGGQLLLGTPVGRERLCFDGHRIFDPQTVIDMFSPLERDTFSLIDDAGRLLEEGVTLEQARACEYGCGLFVFVKARSTSHRSDSVPRHRKETRPARSEV